MRTAWMVLWIPAFLAAGCGCGGESQVPINGGCVDEDGDGFGVGDACEGPDCDDTNPDVWASGDDGCPCDPAEHPDPEPCYTGPEDTAGVGVCMEGERSCVDGAWTDCEGEVVPGEEVCDDEGQDEDCDGDANEGVVNSCGTCGLCEDTIGGDDDPWDPGRDDSDSVVVDENGDLTIGGTNVSQSLIWIPQSLQGAIAKIDTRTRTELGRYMTGPLGGSPGYWSPPGDNPSRTSVDNENNAYVANRSFSGQSSVSKFLANDCPDVDEDGTVETSHAFDEVLPWGEDECLAWNTPVGNPNAIARAAALEERVGVDGFIDVYVWVGLFNERRFLEISAATGELTGVDVPVGVTPYGAAIDVDSNMWCATLGPSICRFNTLNVDDREVINKNGQSYGITVDGDGNVWTGGANVAKFDTLARTWAYEWHASQGISADARGRVWTQHQNTEMGWYDQDDLTSHTIINGFGGRGVAVDNDGLVWVVNWGDVAVIDPALALPANAGELDICCDQIDGAYVYSDMTGFQLRNATHRVGHYDRIFEGCGAGEQVTWTEIVWEATTPASTWVHFEVRTANAVEDLDGEAWMVAASQPDDESPVEIEELLGEAAGRAFLEVRTTLVDGNAEAPPVLHSLGVRRICTP